MKKINFEIVFKIIVLIQLTLILLISLFRDSSNNSQVAVEPNEIGRYKEIKRIGSGFGGKEEVYILDTKTGKYVDPD
jgi:hypothetical protein